jgi:small subunit ribosomal protein S18
MSPWYNRRRKTCLFCEQGIDKVDYKDVNTLREFLTARGKIRSQRQTGACAQHQRQISKAVKRARHIALLSYVSE